MGNQASPNFKADKEPAISGDEADRGLLSTSQENEAYVRKNPEICEKTAFSPFVLP